MISKATMFNDKFKYRILRHLPSIVLEYLDIGNVCEIFCSVLAKILLLCHFLVDG